MAETHLTKRETDVMEIFWAHDEDLSARDIQQYLPDITVNSIQPVLKRLQKKEYIHVSGFSQHTFDDLVNCNLKDPIKTFKTIIKPYLNDCKSILK